MSVIVYLIPDVLKITFCIDFQALSEASFATAKTKGAFADTDLKLMLKMVANSNART